MLVLPSLPYTALVAGAAHLAGVADEVISRIRAAASWAAHAMATTARTRGPPGNSGGPRSRDALGGVVGPSAGNRQHRCGVRGTPRPCVVVVSVASPTSPTSAWARSPPSGAAPDSERGSSREGSLHRDFPASFPFYSSLLVLVLPLFTFAPPPLAQRRFVVGTLGASALPISVRQPVSRLGSGKTGMGLEEVGLRGCPPAQTGTHLALV